jgi:hypothetical protein
VTAVHERSGEPTVEGPAAGVQAADLIDAATELREAVDALSDAVLRGTAIERAAARDRFEVALATYSAQVDATAV